MTHKGTNNISFEERKLRSEDSDLMTESETSSFQPELADMNPNTNDESTESYPFQFVPLTMGGNGRTNVASKASRTLIEREVSMQNLEAMTTSFYEKAFLDKTLDAFIRSHEDPHGSRFAKWIVFKLTGSSVWDDDRRARSKVPVTLADGIQYVVHDRSSAHAAAWYSPKRPENHVGRHFQLDECRIWMRLHFWAMRESGIMTKSPSFADYYVRFIAHFVRVYESTAPNFARDSLRWSENSKNVEEYIEAGRVMKDVLGLTLQEAREQIPAEEANDDVWPYNRNPQ